MVVEILLGPKAVCSFQVSLMVVLTHPREIEREAYTACPVCPVWGSCDSISSKSNPVQHLKIRKNHSPSVCFGVQ
jgi:hypothetical protein